MASQQEVLSERHPAPKPPLAEVPSRSYAELPSFSKRFLDSPPHIRQRVGKSAVKHSAGDWLNRFLHRREESNGHKENPGRSFDRLNDMLGAYPPPKDESIRYIEDGHVLRADVRLPIKPELDETHDATIIFDDKNSHGSLGFARRRRTSETEQPVFDLLGPGGTPMPIDSFSPEDQLKILGGAEQLSRVLLPSEYPESLAVQSPHVR